MELKDLAAQDDIWAQLEDRNTSNKLGQCCDSCMSMFAC